MNTFFSLETCRKLQEAGCVSGSGFYFPDDAVKRAWGPQQGFGQGTRAYFPYDFLAETEQADKNRKIVWGDEPFTSDCPFCDNCRIPVACNDPLFQALFAEINKTFREVTQ